MALPSFKVIENQALRNLCSFYSYHSRNVSCLVEFINLEYKILLDDLSYIYKLVILDVYVWIQNKDAVSDLNGSRKTEHNQFANRVLTLARIYA